eukprot:TRINITY_DN39507_c0_g1_i1.p1 TRINITY_DN39507_c0_g1~~TRINITY_DN39507_c0_g1_i1.p1  ORF type:complete len:497 (-),score=52.00 TRINITY_DN39507_c0_g1_i1:76-1566(-)
MCHMLVAACKRWDSRLGRYLAVPVRHRGSRSQCRLLTTSPRKTPLQHGDPRAVGAPRGVSVDTGMDHTLMKHVGVLTGSQFVVNMGIAVIIPILPALALQLGLSTAAVGFVVTCPSITRLLMNMPAGQLADRFGRKPLMVGGTLLSAIGGIGTGLASSFVTLVSFRLLVGCGSAASHAGATAYIADLTAKAPQHRAKILAFQHTLVNGAYIAGPALGGIIAEAYGAQAAFLFVGGGAALCSLGYSFLPETLTAAQASSVKDKRHQIGAAGSDWAAGWPLRSAPLRRFWLDWRDLVTAPPQQAVIALNAALHLGFSCELCIVTLHIADTLNASPGELGQLFSVVVALGIAAAPLGGWLADRAVTRQSVIVPGLCIATAGMSSLAFADSYPAFVAGMALFGVGTSLADPAIEAYAVDVTPSDSRGRAAALYRQAQDVAWLGCPVTLGLLADLVDKPTAILCGSGIFASLTAFFLWRSTRKKFFARAAGRHQQNSAPKA